MIVSARYAGPLAVSATESDEMIGSPTKSPPQGLSPTLERNIESITARRQQVVDNASREQRAAAAISRFAGSMRFVYLHIALFTAWIAVNEGFIPGLPRWDPSLVILAMEASVEAIFLSAFILINQNRMAVDDDARADLNLQISLLNEHETTKLISLVEQIAKHAGVVTDTDPDIAELKRDVAPVAVLDRLEKASAAAE